MAKENTVYLYGMAVKAPQLKINAEGRFVSGKLILLTVRRSYATEDLLLRGVRRYDYPCVFSWDDGMIAEEIAKIRAGDMVRVKGTLCTSEVHKRFICTACNHEEIREGVVIYVDPIFIRRCEEHIMQPFEKKLQDLDRHIQETAAFEETSELLEKLRAQREACLSEKMAEGQRLVQQNEEVSNEVKLIGTLCRDPVLYEDEMTRKIECAFQVASNRIRRIRQDAPDKKTDYPWVKAFGMRAREYYQALRTNSSIYISGAISVRTVERDICCQNCGATFQRLENTAEIVPYGIEYLKNCIIPAKLEEEDLDGEEK